MLSLLVLVTLAQTPEPAPKADLAVLVSRRINLPMPRAEAIGELVTGSLRQRGYSVMGPTQSRLALAQMGLRDPAECDGKRECVSGLARVLKVATVVSVDAALFDDNLALHLELVDAERAEPRATADRVGLEKKLESELHLVMAPILAGLQPIDAPTQVALEPSPVTSPLVEPAPHEVRSAVPAVAVTIAAAAVAITSIIFLASGSTQKSALDSALDTSGPTPVYRLTQAEAEATAARANTAFSVSLGTGIGAGVLGVLAGILFAAR
jgi:hypothetical protein